MEDYPDPNGKSAMAQQMKVDSSNRAKYTESSQYRLERVTAHQMSIFFLKSRIFHFSLITLILLPNTALKPLTTKH